MSVSPAECENRPSKSGGLPRTSWNRLVDWMSKLKAASRFWGSVSHAILAGVVCCFTHSSSVSSTTEVIAGFADQIHKW